MAWLWFDEAWANHAKFEIISDAAFRLWCRATAFVQTNRTDGFVPSAIVPTLARSKKWEALARELVGAVVKPGGVGLWIAVEGGYAFHDWLEYQPTAAAIRSRTEAKSAARQEAGRRGGLASAEARGKQTDSKPTANRQQTDSKISAPLPLPLPLGSTNQDHERARTSNPDETGVRTCLAHDPTVDDDPVLDADDESDESDEHRCRAHIRRVALVRVNLDEVNRKAQRLVSHALTVGQAVGPPMEPSVAEAVDLIRPKLREGHWKPSSALAWIERAAKGHWERARRGRDA